VLCLAAVLGCAAPSADARKPRHRHGCAHHHHHRTCSAHRRVRRKRKQATRPAPAPRPAVPPAAAAAPGSPPEPLAPAGPLADARLYIDPDSNARRQADAWRATRPADAAAMDKLAGRPVADWFGDWNGDVRAAVAARTARIAAAGATAVYVAYNIPARDCGGYSAGGSGAADAYRRWIDAFAAGLGDARAAVILEPDALAGLDCLPAAEQATRMELLAYAVRALAADRSAAVYLDAGNAAWQPAGVMAARLRSAGIGAARGFALNVSNFRSTADSEAYGLAVSAALGGGVPFVIDTSRNGAGPAPGDVWCNPPGRGLGTPPTTDTGRPLVDAYLWVKAPGESDGACNGGPPAGTWWPEYALGLAQRAGW